jgi:hypothetical protein
VGVGWGWGEGSAVPGGAPVLVLVLSAGRVCLASLVAASGTVLVWGSGGRNKRGHIAQS